MADNEFLTGYLSGQNEGRSNDGGMFGNGWEGIIGLIVILGILNGGWGGGFGGFGGNGSGLQGMATRADINAGFQFNDLQNSVRGIERGLCDGFYSVQGGFNTLSSQLAQCCCDNRAAIADLKYTIATEDCATRNLMQNNTRDIIDATNAGFRAVMDRLAQSDYNALREKYEDVRTQNLLLNQNNVTRAMFDAGVAEVVRRTGNDYPVPCYPVQPPTPLHFPINSCGQVQFGGYGNATGYGNGYAYAA